MAHAVRAMPNWYSRGLAHVVGASSGPKRNFKGKSGVTETFKSSKPSFFFKKYLYTCKKDKNLSFRESYI
jgi:hypothetical protein